MAGTGIRDHYFRTFRYLEAPRTRFVPPLFPRRNPLKLCHFARRLIPGKAIAETKSFGLQGF